MATRRTAQDHMMAQIMSSLKEYSVEEIKVIVDKHKAKQRFSALTAQLNQEDRKRKRRNRRKDEDRSEDM